LLVSYLLPDGLPVSDFERLMDGVDDSCRAHGSAVIGGNLGDAPFIQLSATALGACEQGRRLSRRGARAGDSLLLVGSPGYLWSTALLKQGYARLDSADEQAVCDRALRPVGQVQAGRLLARTRGVHAAIDISDGLYPSVESLCALNQVGVAPVLDPLPLEVCRQANVDPFAMMQLWGDWTLLIAVDGSEATAVCDALQSAGLPGHEIGQFRPGADICVERDGKLTAWSGVDAERFTESSWRSSKLRDYLSELVAQS
jgi:thiamine-monophosphate kinase